MKICLWMNMPSHHQSAFFDSLSSRYDVDLEVRYYKKVDGDRKKLGWADNENISSYEDNIENIDEIYSSVPDWKDRIHIVPGFSSPFLKSLLDLLIEERVRWVHWSERSGVGLAKMLNFNYRLMNFLYPAFLYFKGYKKYAKQINTYALGAFAIGTLAKKDFIKWGIESNKIEFLPYSLAGLQEPKKISQQLKNSDELLFMYIGSLYKLKGIDILLNVFQELSDKSDKWKLILIGDDRSNGKYSQQAEKLKIQNKVNFLSVVESKKINEYLSQADVFVLPTLFDGWGAVLNEAASLNKPLISTDQAGAAYHMIKDEQNGFIVKAGDEKSLSVAMQFYIDHPEQIIIHGKKSFEIFQNFTPDRNTELFVSNLYSFLEKE